MRVTCDYCNRPATLVPASELYPRRPELIGKHFWKCAPCAAWVGCHPHTSKPLGRLANAELRKAKMRAHRIFDPIWKSGRMTRTEAYALLAAALQISKANCHIGMFDVDRCAAVARIAAAMRQREAA